MFKLVVFSTFLAVATSSPNYLAAPLVISHGPVVATTLVRSPDAIPVMEDPNNPVPPGPQVIPIAPRTPAIRPAKAPPLAMPIVYGARHGYDD